MNGRYGDTVSITYNIDRVLSANEKIPAGTKTDTDSDFYLLGLILNVFTSLLFTLQIRDASGNYLSNTPIFAANIQAQGPIPYTFQGNPRVFPPGSLISVDLAELSGAENTIQLGFVGLKHFTLPPAVCGPLPLSERYAIR